MGKLSYKLVCQEKKYQINLALKLNIEFKQIQ